MRTPPFSQPGPVRPRVGLAPALAVFAVLAGCAAPYTNTPSNGSAVSDLGRSAAQSGAAVGEVADDVADTPKPVPVPGTRSAEPGFGYSRDSAPKDGTYVIGVDLDPGTYRSAGATPGVFELCIWSTRKGAATNSDMIDFGSANADEQQIVEIGSKVKAFETNGCEPWEKVQ